MVVYLNNCHLTFMYGGSQENLPLKSTQKNPHFWTSGGGSLYELPLKSEVMATKGEGGDGDEGRGR